MAGKKLHSGNKDYETLAFERRSIRGFTKDPVPKELIREVLAIAQRAPSSMNTQPWHFHVLTGDPLDRIRKGRLAFARPVLQAAFEAVSHRRAHQPVIA